MAKMLLCVSVILSMCCWASFVESQDMKYKDPKQPLIVRITDLMKRMTLKEKIGQMTQIDSYVGTPEVVQKYFIGKFQYYPSFQILEIHVKFLFLLILGRKCINRWSKSSCKRDNSRGMD